MQTEQPLLPCTGSHLFCWAPFQHLPDHSSPFVGHNGFQEEGINPEGPELLRRYGVAKTGAENDGNVRSNLA